MTVFRTLSVLIITFLMSLSAQAFFVSSDTDPLGIPPDVGHEEITRQALITLGSLLEKSGNDILVKVPNIVGNRDPLFSGMIGNGEVSVITRGNYATDMPRGAYLISLNDYWGFPANAGWNNPIGQHLHFLRDYIDKNTLASAYDTCETAREKILLLSIDVIKNWQAGQFDRALFLLGHATHTIQDSFSPAHTIRALSDHNNDPLDVCYYPDGGPKEIPSQNICFHQSVDPRDNIWLDANDPAEIKKTEEEWLPRGEQVAPVQDLKSFDPFAQNVSEADRHAHLKHEARLARDATTKYIFLVLQDLQGRQSGQIQDPNFRGLNAKLVQNLFEGNNGIEKLKDIMPEGIMRCRGLAKDPVAIRRVAQAQTK